MALKINFTDIGNFAKGAIERDRVLTKEALEDRKEELKANQQAMITMKAKKYDAEIEDFKKENDKYKAIKAVNDQFDNQKITASQWGQAYLRETDKATYLNLIKQYEGDTTGLNRAFASYYTPKLAEYGTSTTRDAIDFKTQEELKKINADYGNKIKNARGDSFLIAQLLGNKNKELTDIESKTVTDAGNGIKLSKEINTQGLINKPTFTIIEEESTLSVPKKFIEDGKIEEKRTKLNSDEAQDVFSKAAINSAVKFFNDNDITKPQQFYKTNNQTGEIEGFKGPGAKLNEHITLLYGGAVDSFTDEKVYIGTNKKPSYASSILNTNNVKNKIDDRIRNYSNINQKKDWFEDRENIIGIVPWSIIDVNDTIGNVQLKTKSQKNLVGELYIESLKDYTKVYNKKSDGTIIESNQKFMNDLQSELLQLRGNSSDTSQVIQKILYNKMADRGLVQATPQTSETPKVGTGSIKITNPATGETAVKADTEANRELAKKLGATVTEININTKENVTQKTGDGSVAESIYGVNKNIPTKKEPTELGDTTFKNLESVLKVLPKPMTGQEIKDNYKIDFPINLQSKFVPLK